MNKEDKKINSYSPLVKEITKFQQRGCSIGGWLFGCCVMPIGAV